MHHGRDLLAVRCEARLHVLHGDIRRASGVLLNAAEASDGIEGGSPVRRLRGRLRGN